MDVKLPSGIILWVEDDATPEQIKARVQAFRTKFRELKEERYAKEKADPTSGMSVLDKFGAGVGSGGAQIARGATNLALPDSLTPEFASDETIREKARLEAPLTNTDSGAFGQMVGQGVATLPVGLGTGAAARALTGATRAGKVLKATLGNPFGRSAVEGATTGAITADPEHRGLGAVIGSALSSSMSGLGGMGGRVNSGLIKKSEAAEDLQHLAGQHGEDIFIPISQSGSEDDFVSRIGKQFYKEALPIVPGVGFRLKGQAAKAADKLREISVREALPPGASMPSNAAKDMKGAVRGLKTEFDKAYDDTVKSYAFNIPSDFDVQLADKITKSAGPKTKVDNVTLGKITTMVRGLVDQFSDGKTTIDGSNLLNVKRSISRLMRGAEGHEKGPLMAADSVIDDIITNDLKQGGSKQNLADLQKYQELTPAYRAFTPLEKSVKAAAGKGGKFNFSTLARNSGRSPEQSIIGELGSEVLDKPAASSTLTGKVLANLGMAGAGFGAFMSVPATLAAIGGGHALASKTAQKAMLGDTAMQRAMVEALRKHPELARMTGSAIRNSVVSEYGDNDGT